jgi:hypothetical protein
MLKALLVAVLAAAPLPALAQGAYYSATPATAPTKSSLITRNTVWKCGDGACTAGKSPDRPATMCELVAQRVGTLQTFTVGGTAFDEASLAKCNARAR